MAGDRFVAGGGLEVTVVQASGGSGVFTGTGVVLLPWMGTRLEVGFTEVIINADKQLVGGSVRMLSQGSVEEVLAAIDQKHPGGSAGGEPSPSGVPPPVVLSGSISEVRVDSAAQQVVVQLAGQAEPIAVSYTAGPVIIQDEAGNRYRVDEQGEVSQEAGSVAGAGGDTGTGTPDGQELPTLLAILDELEAAVNAWLEVHGKGPLSATELQALADLPAGLPADELLLSHLSDHTFDQVREQQEASTSQSPSITLGRRTYYPLTPLRSPSSNVAKRNER